MSTTCYITNCVIRQGYSEPSAVFVAGIAPVFSVLVLQIVFLTGKTEEAICAVAVLIGVSPLKGAYLPLDKPVIVVPPDLPVYLITSL